MDDPQAFPLWLIPVVFPLFFVGLWLFITGLLSTIGGWNVLARLYPEPVMTDRAAIRSVRGASLHLRRRAMPLPTNYNHCVTVGVSPAGLHLRTAVFFRFRHPPLLIPWTEMESVEPEQVLLWHTLAIQPRGAGTHIRLYGGAANLVEEAWGQLAARSPAAAPA